MPKKPYADAWQDDAEPFKQHEADGRAENDGRCRAANYSAKDAIWAEQQAERRRQEVFDADERIVLEEACQLYGQIRQKIDTCCAEKEKNTLTAFKTVK